MTDYKYLTVVALVGACLPLSYMMRMIPSNAEIDSMDGTGRKDVEEGVEMKMQ